MSTITQKEWLDFLHLLHNKLRNSKGLKLTEMPALLEISNFMLFRFLDNDNLGIKIDKKMKFKEVYKKYATDEKIKEDHSIPYFDQRNCYKLWRAIYDVQHNKDECLIIKYFECEHLNKYLDSATSRVSAFMDKSQVAETVQDIVNTIYKKFEKVEFNSEFFDMFGSAYEQFKTNACGNSGKHTAQHFTNTYIKKIVIEELKPTHKEIFYEPCAGSGGFIHTADHYVVENEGIEKAKTFKKNLYANECNPEIFRPLVLNMLFHNIPINNIREKDSLSNDNVEEMKEKADVIATNYPFGMSMTLKDGDNEWNAYWEVLKQNKSSYVKNSSAQFVVHIYHSLKKNGRAGFVSDRGILNNGGNKSTSWESKLRQFMFEQNNIYKIVFLPQGSFTYTNFQTCIIFMKKGKPTKECKLYNAVFKVPKDKTSEIIVEPEPIKVFNMKELKENNYVIRIEEQKEEIKEGFITLGEIVKFVRGKTITIEKMIDGPYKVIGGGYTFMDRTHNEYNCDEKTVIMSGDGAYAGYLNRFNEKIFITNHCNKMIVHDAEKYNKDYIYYYLKIKYQANLTSRDQDGFQKGQAQPAIDLQKMYERIQLPDISFTEQNEIVEFLEKQFEKYNIELLTPYTKEIDLFKLLIHKKYEQFADMLHIIYQKIETNALCTIYNKVDKDDMCNKIEIIKKKILKMNQSEELSNIIFLKSSKIETEQFLYTSYSRILQEIINNLHVIIENICTNNDSCDNIKNSSLKNKVKKSDRIKVSENERKGKQREKVLIKKIIQKDDLDNKSKSKKRIKKIVKNV
ncbi:MAG: type I restriction-modification system, M subunit [Dasosvirus sp.]|uniref:site-specific DNA-methyltransferase (adenine-specific) n=1 Tax=Dasosvirus sp. TaxID=2487764 RepID=A0A3G4ZVP9_9VIRU|nr:MAG: type I restriction-modification system, M subunit [Dasosvirus sp.]